MQIIPYPHNDHQKVFPGYDIIKGSLKAEICTN